MKHVSVGCERASTETWALTPQVHIYERRGKSFVQIDYSENNEKRAPPYICVLSTFVFVRLFFLVDNATLLGIISFTTRYQHALPTGSIFAWMDIVFWIHPATREP